MGHKKFEYTYLCPWNNIFSPETDMGKNEELCWVAELSYAKEQNGGGIGFTMALYDDTLGQQVTHHA